MFKDSLYHLLHPHKFRPFVASGLMLLFVGAQTVGQVFALSQAQIQVFNEGIGYFDTEVNACTASSSTTVLVGNDNAHKIYNYFIGKGYAPAWAAGIVGNIKVESHFDPEDYQGDEKDYPTPPGNLGWGIVQWTPPSKILDYAQSVNQPPNALSTQLDFVYKQLEGTAPNNNEKAAGDKLKQTTDAYSAAVAFLQYYERAADHAPDGPNAQARGNYAVQFLASINGGAPVDTGGGTVTASISCGGSVNCASNPSTTTLSNESRIRQNVVCLAQQELAAWESPGSPPRMQYLKYSQNTQEKWCADFVSWLYEQAHYPIRPDPGWREAAVLGIRSVGQQNQNFHYHALKQYDSTDSSFMDTSYVPKPGDMAIHLYTDSSGQAHQHVNLVTAVNGTNITLVGGDQGQGPYGGPSSASVVSSYIAHGFTDDNIVGYVSPD